MADTSALDALAALADELQAARAAVRSYETMLNWHVTCERCAAQLDELYAATVAREVLSAALDSPPGAATLVELATEAARRLTGIADLDAERAAHMQRWAEQAEPMLGIRGHERECADRAGRRRELSRPFLAERLAERLVDVEERLTGERDRARGTAANLEAENARLREGIERLCSDIDNPLRERHDESPHDLPEVAEDLRALLADTDSAQDEGAE